MRGWLTRRKERRTSGGADASAAAGATAASTESTPASTARAADGGSSPDGGMDCPLSTHPLFTGGTAAAAPAMKRKSSSAMAGGEPLPRGRAASTIQPWHRETEDDLRSRLGEEIFTESYDPYRSMLMSVPSTTAAMSGDDEVTMIAEWMGEEMMRVDVDRDRVKSKLSKAVTDRSDDFLAGLRGVQQLDNYTRMAGINIGTSRRSLHSARELMVVKNIKVVQLKRRHERLCEVRSLVAMAKECAECEHAVRVR